MDSTLKGKSALITGSVRGLGRTIAKVLAAQGCNIMLNGFADADSIERLRSEIERTCGVRVLYHGADLRNVADIEELAASMLRSFGGFDILVNNAVVRFPGPAENFKVNDWNDALAVNLSAPFHLIRLALPLMRQAQWGRIVNIASVLGLTGTPNHADYVTTKTGLVGLTKAIALEVVKTEITCNAICPGTMLTPAIENMISGFARRDNVTYDTALRTYLSNRLPAERFVNEDAVAGLVSFLCSPFGRDVNGAALPIDGAWSAGR